MMLKVTKAIHNVGQKRLEAMFATGAFPEVNYSKSGGWETYSLFEYCNVWGKLMKILDNRIKINLGEPLGIFTRKHSATFLNAVEILADGIVEADIIGQKEHMRTIADLL